MILRAAPAYASHGDPIHRAGWEMELDPPESHYLERCRRDPHRYPLLGLASGQNVENGRLLLRAKIDRPDVRLTGQ